LPLTMSDLERGNSLPRKARRKNSPATANRMATFSTGVASRRMNFIAINVLPQMSVVARSASSALDLEVTAADVANKGGDHEEVTEDRPSLCRHCFFLPHLSRLILPEQLAPMSFGFPFQEHLFVFERPT